MQRKGPNRLYTSHEVGELLQVDPSSVVKWVNDGILPAYRTPGGHRRIKQSDLLTFLRAHHMYVPRELQVAKRVLLVDDDTGLLNSLSRAMKSHADQVELFTESSPVLALVKVGSLGLDAVVLDVHMEQMDGFKACQILKSQPETKDLEIFLITGKPTSALEAKARECGARALLHKPITASALTERLTGAQAE